MPIFTPVYKQKNIDMDKLATLPRFMIAENTQEYPDLVFVIHNDSPRFMLQVDLEEEETDETVDIIHWIDPEPEDENFVDDLVDEAYDFLDDELENQDRLSEEEEDDED